MAKYLTKRTFYIILTLLIVTTITFFMMKFMPGTPLTNQDKLSHTQIQTIYKQYGLDLPLWQQYWNYLVNAVHGNFGTSFQFSNQPVSYLIFSRLGVSVQLGLQAMLVGVVLGIIIGAFSAIQKGTWADSLMTVIAILGVSIPSFVLAIILQYYLGLKLGWFPIADWDSFRSTILPTMALAVLPLAESARFMRTQMIDVLSTDYIELAKAKGFSKFQMIFHHALRNSLIPLVTIIGPLSVGIMTGSMVVENIFSIPGIGDQFVKSVLTNDYPTIMGLTIVYCFMLCVVLLITDILYSLIDPRIKLNGKEAAS